MLKPSKSKKLVQQSIFGGNNDRYCLEVQEKNGNSSKTLSILHWNVNGLNAILKKQPFLDFFSSHQYSIINLSETKLTKEKLLKMEFQKNELWFQKYNQYWIFSVAKKGYSGCCTLS